MSKCKMVIFSDVHYAGENPIDLKKLRQYSLPIVDTITKLCNTKIKPDLVFCLGDLIDDNAEKLEDAKKIKQVLDHIQKLSMPSYTLTGNHDLRPYDSRLELEKLVGYNFGSYSFDKCGYHFVVLNLEVCDSTLNDAYGIARTHYLSNNDLEWLAQNLKHTTLPTIIVSHYSIAHEDMTGNRWFENAPLDVSFKNNDAILDIIKDKNVIALFNGHEHWTKNMVENDNQFYTIGSIVENIKNQGIPDGVYYVVELENNNIKVAEKHIVL